MKRNARYVYPQKIYTLLRQITSDNRYDRKLDPLEMELLKNWLHHHEHHLRPSSLLLAVLGKRLEDTKTPDSSPTERNRISVSNSAEQQINSQVNESKLSAEGDSVKLERIFTDNFTVSFDGKCFQFSGKLEFGKREDAILVVEMLGGFSPSGNSLLTKLVNYLVVGSLETHAPKRNGYGGNINKAMSLNRETHQRIHIIRERDFVKAALKHIHRFESRETPFIKTAITYKSLSDRASRVNKSRRLAVHFK